MIRHSAPTLGIEEQEASARVLASGQIAQGPEVEAFEKECAAYVGARFAVALNSGTSALHLALAAHSVAAGEPVGIQAYACAALATAVQLQDGAPAPFDADKDGNFASMPQCRLGIFAPLFGASWRLPAGPRWIDDIAQCMQRSEGNGAVAWVTSFYATKLMTTGGEGGMVFTDDPGIAEQVRDLREYDKRDDFKKRFNYKMTDLQAAIGRVQLRRLPRFIERRRTVAEQYAAGLKGLPLELPSGPRHVFWRYVVATSKRDELEAHLLAQGIEAKRPVFGLAHHDERTSLKHAERAHKCNLSLPIYPSILDEDVAHVVRCVRDFFG